MSTSPNLIAAAPFNLLQPGKKSGDEEGQPLQLENKPLLRTENPDRRPGDMRRPGDLPPQGDIRSPREMRRRQEPRRLR